MPNKETRLVQLDLRPRKKIFLLCNWPLNQRKTKLSMKLSMYSAMFWLEVRCQLQTRFAIYNHFFFVSTLFVQKGCSAPVATRNYKNRSEFEKTIFDPLVKLKIQTSNSAEFDKIWVDVGHFKNNLNIRRR